MSLKIMVVDHEPKFPKLLRSLAIPMGHAVSAFEDCQASVDRIRSQRLDVAFLSMNLPETDRMELVGRIRNSDPSRDAIIAFLCETEEISAMRKGLGQGADLILAGPVSADRLTRMLSALEPSKWKMQRAAARLPLFTQVVCTWNDSKFSVRSFNISETGMLLQSPNEVGIDQQIRLEFKIQEIGTSFDVLARIARKEGTERIAVAFVNLTREDQNAIHLYVTGQTKDSSPPKRRLEMGPRRLFPPNR
jgi:CheY-like chemotaxis protein